MAAIGSSAQYPIGYSILSSYFPKNRGTVIALNISVSNVGTLIATPLATLMLLFMGWRMIFFTVSSVSIIMGLVYFAFRDYRAPSRQGSGKARLAQSFTSYRRVLKNRNMVLIALVFMVGGAGRKRGVNETYFSPHLANDFGYTALRIGILITAMNIGGILGPIFFGWLSDRLNRTRVLQISLVLSCLGSLCSPGHEWVGAERGSLRPVSPLPPLRPCMRLSHSHGHRQEDLQGSIFPEPLRVHSP